MALVNQQVQCSYAPSRPLSWTGKIESKRFLAAFPKVGTYGILSNHTSFLCITVPPLIHVLKRKSLRMSSSKGGVQDNKEIMYDAQEFQNIEAPVTIESNGTIAGSVAVQNLFKNWLTLLRMPLPHQPAEGMLEGPFLHKIVEAEDSVQDSGRGEILKIVWCNLLGLHSTIKIPAIIFIPMYLAVSMKYGAEIVKELTPLWIGGPLIVAAYVIIIQLISSLYILSFRQSVKLLKKSPMVYDYVAGGKLNEVMRVRLWIPVASFLDLRQQRNVEKNAERFSSMGGGYMDGLCGINMAFLLQVDQVFEESKFYLSFCIISIKVVAKCRIIVGSNVTTHFIE